MRDSIFDGDPVGARSNAMTIESTRKGMMVVLYPPWWPAGVKLTFDSTLAGGRERLGTAVAMVADGYRKPSRARTRAWQVTCQGRSP